MIDLKRRIVDQQSTNFSDNTSVKSSIVDSASVTVKEDSIDIKLFMRKSETDVQEFNAPDNLIDVFGTGKIYKFLFVLFEQVTDMNKSNISSYIRSEAVAGHSMRQDGFEVRIEIPKRRILSESAYYRDS